MLLASSVTSIEPSLRTVTQTGLPYTLLFEALTINPVKKSSTLPDGLLLLNGIKITLYPANEERFHDPCCAMNAPP